MPSAPPPSPIFLVESDTWEELVPHDLVFSSTWVDTIVRLADWEYPDHLEPRDVFTHFNLGTRLQPTDTSYLLSRILKHGKYADRDSQQNAIPPLLGFQDVHIARCEEAGVLTYDQLDARHLAYSFPHLRTVEDIQKIIVARYQASLPEQTREQILAQGLVYAHFRVIRRVSFILQNGVFVPLN